MVIELINTGTELLLGRVLNTHQQWICRQLADHGFAVERQTAVHDGGDSIQQSVREALMRADLVITTGGLGPTADDLTRQRIAELLDLSLRHDPTVDQSIRHYFESRGRRVPERTKVEAQVPLGAKVWLNDQGTAPGLSITVDPNPFRADGRRSTLVMLPGPPRELRPMFKEQVLPWIEHQFPQEKPFFCRTLRTTGLGESHLEERVSEPLKSWTDAGLELGYCARVGEVELRIATRGADAEQRVGAAVDRARALLSDHIFGEGDETLEEVLVRELTAKAATLVLAESCTGGFIANRLTNVPGASAVLQAGIVSYSNASKTQLLGVGPEVIEKHGAVSETVAREMAEGARRVSGADWAIAVTGIAGPSGGSVEKPVGTVFIAWSGPNGTHAVRQLNTFDRETFKFLTAQQAMHGLLRALRSE